MTKKHISAIAVLLLAAFSLQAQNPSWWLFPGKGRKAKETRERKDTVTISTPVLDSLAALSDSLKAAQDSLEAENAYIFESADRISLLLMLPLGADGEKSSANFMEMYSGALLAVRDLSGRGVKMDVEVIDTRQEGYKADRSLLEGRDVIIGPVASTQLEELMEFCQRQTVLVSPLEPKAAALCEKGRVIQAPTPWKCQVDELLNWLSEERAFNDRVLVLKDAGESQLGEQSRYLLEQLDERGIAYSIITDLGQMSMDKLSTNRLLIASDTDSFITRAIKQASTKAEQGCNIVLYCTSKVRNCVGPDVKDLHYCSARLTAAYYVDYNSQDVRNFVLSYRALFKSEPGSFAFQGYDLVNYFVGSCERWGKRWSKKLSGQSFRGLHSDFVFDSSFGNGKVNKGVRRIVYDKNLSTTLLK